MIFIDAVEQFMKMPLDLRHVRAKHANETAAPVNLMPNAPNAFKTHINVNGRNIIKLYYLLFCTHNFFYIIADKNGFFQKCCGSFTTFCTPQKISAEEH